MIGKIALQFAMATALPCAAAFAAEELWSVREGANGEIDGV